MIQINLKTPIYFYFFIFTVLFSNGLKAFESPPWNSPSWHSLLHYTKNHIAGVNSQADSPSFFLAKTGKNSAKSEWDANVQKILVSRSKQELSLYACKFPARFTLIHSLDLQVQQHAIAKNFDILKSCLDFYQFYRKINSDSISLVFSSYFLNTPASAFGHTLLKFNRSQSMYGFDNDLLDYAVNYAAVVTTSNSFVYSVMGLTGGFRGEFAVMPYFYKIREYNDYESRDLWEYKLSLKKEEIHRLIAHLWELKQTYFDYYYLSENCSYFMLKLLDVARPELQFTQKMNHVVVPVDTVRLVGEVPQLIQEVKIRPSLYNWLNYRLKNLSLDEQNQFDRLRPLIDQLENLPNNKLLDEQLIVLKNDRPSVALTDLLIDYMDWKYPKELNTEKHPLNYFKNHFLSYRSSKETIAPMQYPMIPQDSPHLTHPSKKLMIGIGHDQWRGSSQTLSFRGALHDPLDYTNGAPKNSLMEMLKINFNVYPKHKQRSLQSKVDLKEFSLINVGSYTAFNSRFSSFSWLAEFGAKTLNHARQSAGASNNFKDPFSPFGAKLGFGLTWMKEDFFIPIFLTLESYHVKALKNQSFVAPGIHIEWVGLNFNPIKFRIKSLPSYELWTKKFLLINQIDISASLNSRWAIEFTAQTDRPQNLDQHLSYQFKLAHFF